MRLRVTIMASPSRRVVLSILVTALGALTFASAPALAAAPTVLTESTSPTAKPSAELRLEATVNAGEEAAGETTECHFQYGATGVTEHEAECEQGNVLEGGEQGVAVTVAGLQAGTTYDYRVVLKNASDKIEGNPETVTTLPVPATEVPSPIGSTTATFKGTLTPLNSTVGTQYFFSYNRLEEIACTGEHTTNPEPGTPLTGSGSETVETAVTELEPNQKYTVCLLAQNAFGTEEDLKSPPIYFTTLAAAPAIAGESVSGVEATAATLDADINPGGAATTAHFEYLSQAQYEADGNTFGEHTISTPESTSVGSDDSVHPATPARIAERGQSPLTPSTTYRYRVVATNTCEGGRHCVTDGPGKTFTTYPAPGSAGGRGSETCPNEARRVEQASTYLPDCRAYELVTPVQKDSGEPEVDNRGIGDHAAVDGDRMAWFSEFSLPGSAAPGLNYLSTRGPDGWSSENAIPPQSVENGTLCPYQVGIDAWSTDLERGILADGLGQGGGSHEAGFQEGYECGHDEPRLVAGEREGFQNLFVRDDENFLRDGEARVNPYELVNVTPSAVPPPTPNGGVYHSAFFLAGSADLSHVVFEEELPLTADAPGYPNGWEGHDDLYEWTASGVRLVTILPEGAPVQGSLAGATKNAALLGEHYNIADYVHAVSEDGSRIFFQANGNLYVRENAEQPPVEECANPSKACTIQVDASQASGPGGGGQFMAANAAGTKVFFMDEASAHLTADTVEGSGENLYEYDLESAKLTDLTPGAEAGVLGVSGASEDGSDVYFVAQGALTGANVEHVSPKPAEPNLYVYHGGVLTFIATLNANSDACDWIEVGCAPEEEAGLTARVSANGAFIGFTSTAQLTSYDNTDANTHNPDNEIYLYDAASETLSCVSCDPSGAAPTAGGASIRPPVGPDYSSWPTNAYPQRYVSNDGQVFFTSSEALLPADTNAEPDVYEYEGGELHLISSGSSDEQSYFLDASVSGSDVFFETAQRLLPRDRDAAYDIYDARVNGGFPEPAAPAAPCVSDEGCAPAAGGRESNQSALSTPASASFLGAGNLTPAPPPTKITKKTVKCKRDFVKKKVKKKETCVKKPKPKKRAKQSGHNRRTRS